MKLAEDNTPMMFRGKNFIDVHRDSFYPICKASFAGNDFGVKLFCKKLGYETGMINERRVPLKDNAVLIGLCSSHDTDLSSCSGSMELGGGCSSNCCEKGKTSGMKVICSGGQGKSHNCGG